MARAPFTIRRSFFERFNRNVQGLRLLDFNIVETVDMGQMVETRYVSDFGDGSKILDIDLREVAPDSLTYLELADFQAQFQGVHGGWQTLQDFSY